MTDWTPIEDKFITAAREMRRQRDNNGNVRWHYAVNWIVSVLVSQNPDFDAAAFYAEIEADEPPMHTEGPTGHGGFTQVASER